MFLWNVWPNSLFVVNDKHTFEYLFLSTDFDLHVSRWIDTLFRWVDLVLNNFVRSTPSVSAPNILGFPSDIRIFHIHQAAESELMDELLSD